MAQDDTRTPARFLTAALAAAILTTLLGRPGGGAMRRPARLRPRLVGRVRRHRRRSLQVDLPARRRHRSRPSRRLGQQRAPVLPGRERDRRRRLSDHHRERGIGRRVSTTPPRDCARSPRATGPSAAWRCAPRCRSARACGRPSGCSPPTPRSTAPGPRAARSTSSSTSAATRTASSAPSTTAPRSPATFSPRPTTFCPAAPSTTTSTPSPWSGSFGEIRWYIDGVQFASRDNWFSTGGPFPAPFDVDFHLLLNLAVGGNLPGPPDGTTVFPQEYVVDYVRVYQVPNDPPTVEITSPTASDTLTPGDDLTITVSATDDGAIQWSSSSRTTPFWAPTTPRRTSSPFPRSRPAATR